MAAGTDLSSPWAATVPPDAPTETPAEAPQRHFAPPPDLPPRSALGGWWRRIAASLMDSLLGLLVMAPVLGLSALASAVSTGLAFAVGIAGYVAAFVFYVWQLVRQGRTGATYGKELFGLRLLTERNGRPIGVVASLARPFVHIIDVLPLYLGYLWPLWDGKRQTFTDKAMGTVVLRVPSRRFPRRIVALALALNGLLVTGAMTALAENAPELVESTDSTASTPSRESIAEQLGIEPEAPPPVGPLPVEDSAGRIAPAAPGFEAVPEDITDLGSLDVAEAAALGGGSDEENQLAADVLRGYGLEGAFGEGFESATEIYTVVAYRFSSPQGTTRFMAELAAAFPSEQPTAVPGATVYDRSGEEFEALAGAFANGSYVYEITLISDVGPVDRADLDALLLAQYEHAQRTG